MTNEINLIPPELRNDTRFAFGKIAVVFIILLIILLVFLTLNRLNLLQRELHNIIEKKEQLNPRVEELKQVSKELQLKKKEILDITSLEETSWRDKLIDLDSKVPAGIFLNHIEADQQKITLRGYSNEFFLLGIFENKLEELKFVKEADLKGIENSDGNYYFTILCKVD